MENSGLYFEPTNQTWFLFTNHIGLDRGGEYTESPLAELVVDVDAVHTTLPADAERSLAMATASKPFSAAVSNATQRRSP